MSCERGFGGLAAGIALSKGAAWETGAESSLRGGLFLKRELALRLWPNEAESPHCIEILVGSRPEHDCTRLAFFNYAPFGRVISAGLQTWRLFREKWLSGR